MPKGKKIATETRCRVKGGYDTRSDRTQGVSLALAVEEVRSTRNAPDTYTAVTVLTRPIVRMVHDEAAPGELSMCPPHRRIEERPWPGPIMISCLDMINAQASKRNTVPRQFDLDLVTASQTVA